MADAATASVTAPAAPANPSAPKGSRKLLWIVLLVVVAALAGGGGFLFTRLQHPAAKAEPPKVATYYNLDPSIVVNFQDARAIRFLQVGISLMTYDPKAVDAAKAADPRIRNALLMLFSGQQYTTLSTEQGKLALQKEALKAVQDIVAQAPGKPHIEALYFTSFVIQ